LIADRSENIFQDPILIGKPGIDFSGKIVDRFENNFRDPVLIGKSLIDLKIILWRIL